MPILTNFTCFRQYRVYRFSNTLGIRENGPESNTPSCPWTGTFSGLRRKRDRNERCWSYNLCQFKARALAEEEKKKKRKRKKKTNNDNKKVWTPNVLYLMYKKKEKKRKKKKSASDFFYQTAEHPFASHATLRRFPILYIYIRSGWRVQLIRESLCMF